ncbi:hypothetical protein [Saccharopolyspora phatthalungensis]|uniref:Uncharacterized protein n=1 Tax=Saccharopolyspora phatthalungensis TaxID=664693 RepID=A0A840QEL4_9PSEU|nr:hypothetical protein [Saccharopolyspora phatthalungensis]MBB5159254.1 hypothetical protein [Saccharopolyspora phatthalungensis]
MDGRAKRYDDDLKQLRKNRGLCLARADQIGAALREACGVDSQDTPAEIVQKVTDAVLRHAAALGEEQRVAALTALGLDGPQTRFLQERELWLAQRLERNPRTARRRIREGFAELASLLAGSSRPAPCPAGTWRTERLRVLLALDQPQPEAFVFRHVIADAEVLDELDLAVTLTASDRSASARENDFSIDVFAGGTLVHRTQETSQRISLALRPPKPLHYGEKHEIAMRFRVAEMLPHYVCVPKGACEEFDLTVRFGDQTPRSIGLLEKVFQNDVHDDAVTGQPLEPDGAGEVRARFRHLEPGFAYGIRWQGSAQEPS